MRIFRFLYLAAFIFGLSGLAKADGIDFHMTVLDGPPIGVNISDGTPFAVNFDNPCPSVGDPALVGATGCFLLVNNTGGTITGLNLTFDNTIGPNNVDFLNGQTPDCASPVFTDPNSPCELNTAGTQYILDFSGGAGIPPLHPNNTAYLAIFGANPDAFVNGMGTATFTPEPSSIVLLSTGIGLMGVFFVGRRRVEGRAVRF